MLPALTVGEDGVAGARQRGRWDAVVLDAEQHAVPPRPFAHRHEEALLVELAERSPEVTTQGGRLPRQIEVEQGEDGQEAVAAAALELSGQVRRPVRVVHLEAVA